MQQIDAPRLFDPDNIKRALWLCCGPAFVFFVTSLSILSLAGFGLVEILRDPAQLTEQSSFLGFLSNVGSWLWVSAAAICFSGFGYIPAAPCPITATL
ncbi:hypothetical protein FDP25_14590 [Roseovarius sp. A21]|uniref:Uncharacterized protein n=1 Tax=Roseovarius bejariae TaxID=2576383 RepID=A0A844D006_9RHOB|nr:hypothetical protein [Roseovarius bejariae]MRU16666.1 hypothetical protein [Roseovarius bejariae]